MKYYEYETYLILLICLVFNINSLKFSFSTEISKSRYRVDENYALPKGPIYSKGWLKYLTYEVDQKEKPKEFYKNLAFYEQMKKGASKSGKTVDLKKEDAVGFVNIPDENHFFFILTENTLNVLSSRKVKII